MEKLIPPVKPGEIIECVVHSIGAKGDPVLKVDTFTVFLKNSKGVDRDQTVKVKIGRVFETYAFAELVA